MGCIVAWYDDSRASNAQTRPSVSSGYLCDRQVLGIRRFVMVFRPRQSKSNECIDWSTLESERSRNKSITHHYPSLGPSVRVTSLAWLSIPRILGPIEFALQIPSTQRNPANQHDLHVLNFDYLLNH